MSNGLCMRVCVLMKGASVSACVRVSNYTCIRERVVNVPSVKI